MTDPNTGYVFLDDVYYSNKELGVVEGQPHYHGNSMQCQIADYLLKSFYDVGHRVIQKTSRVHFNSKPANECSHLFVHFEY